MRAETRSIESIADEWEALADRVNAGPFERPGWISAWLDAFETDSFEVLTVHRDDELAGVLPLVGSDATRRSPTNLETPRFGFVVDEPATARRLAEELRRFRHIELMAIDPADPAFGSFMAGLAASGFLTLTRPLLLSPYLDTTGDWNTYLRGRDGKLRSEMRRRRRRLEDLGELTFEVCDGRDRLAELLDEGFAIEASGWKGTYGTAINSQPQTRGFYEDVAAWAAASGTLRLAFLRLDGRPIAFDLCLETADTHYLVKTGYDREFARFGPGVLLRAMMLERAFDAPTTRYEFLGTVEGANNTWKRRWSATDHERIRVDAFAGSLAGRVAWTAHRQVIPLSRRARTAAAAALTPAGRDRVKRLNHRLRRLIRS